MHTTPQEIEDKKHRIEVLGRIIAELENDVSQIKARISEAKADRHKELQKLLKLEVALKKKHDHFEIKVTDHAVIRYMERVLQFNVDSVRSSILTERNKKMIEFARDCRIKHDGVELVVKNGAVTTVIASGEELK